VEHPAVEEVVKYATALGHHPSPATLTHARTHAHLHQHLAPPLLGVLKAPRGRVPFACGAGTWSGRRTFM
jgi:hypothetical protein